MNNPFSRLKHYLPDEIDSQENHATECLAACLVFSEQLRESFIQFLSGNDVKLEVEAPSKVEVVTQQSIEGGYVDLVLQLENKLIVAVEVKVNASEKGPHHREQLEKYRKWLDGQNKTKGYLFTLVCDPDNSFHPEKFGANARRSWRDLYQHFKKMPEQDDLSDVEWSIIKNFCEYLESEGIVSTYETKDLLCYSAGLKARKAVAGIFNQISSRLVVDGFQCESSEDRKDCWPLLKIEHPAWKKIFGKGKNQKISLWFTVPGIWGATTHDFGFEIELWNEEHGNDWKITDKRLPIWFERLKSQKCEWDVYQTRRKPLCNIPARELRSEPKRIAAWRGETILNQSEPQKQPELVNLLVEQAKQYAKIVSSLES